MVVMETPRKTAVKGELYTFRPAHGSCNRDARLRAPLRILVPTPNSAHYSRSRPRLPALMLRVNGCAGSPASYGSGSQWLAGSGIALQIFPDRGGEGERIHFR